MSSWWENEEAWGNLRRHCATCKDDTCGCNTLFRNFHRWSTKLPIDCKPKAIGKPGNTWLWFAFNKHGRFRVQCVACHADVDLDDDDLSQSCQLLNLQKHHASFKHAEVSGKMFPFEHDRVARSTPTRQAFKEVLEQAQKGLAPCNDGYQLSDCLVGKRKSEMMLWCLS
jgi:hypothetical protein